ncbi:hypothetical protein ANN_07522, partial [Periplaneta americana]
LYPGRWIGRGGVISWPPRSPDFTPLDYCVWGWLKSEIYKCKVETREELLARILHACTQVKECPNQLRSAKQHLSTRAAKCIEVDGGLFEHVLMLKTSKNPNRRTAHAFCQDTRDVQYRNNVSEDWVGVEGKVGRMSTEFKAKANPFAYNSTSRCTHYLTLRHELCNNSFDLSTRLGSSCHRSSRVNSGSDNLTLNDDLMSRDENIVRNGNIKIGNLSFEEVEKFKYLGATVTNINDTGEEIKRRINMGNACYYSVEKLLSSSLLSKNLKVRIYKTVTGCSFMVVKLGLSL